ncbi:MAG: nodulation protein NfeD [Chloroflexota bacterium]|nr:nodulation protein NfeD [Chloroflexota bacterium]
MTPRIRTISPGNPAEAGHLRPRPLRVLTLFVAMTLIMLGLVGNALAQSESPVALTLEIDGVINPVKVRYLERALQQAQDSNARLLIIRLNTPGGLLESTRKMVEMQLESEIPTVVYVAPRGSQAGSAGTFLVAASNVAVMAPGTNIGAATPVSSSGQDLNETLANKITNDAAALIRSLAEERDRNAESLEETVRQGSSFTATEAVNLGMVDFIAADEEELLARLNGIEVTTTLGAVVLNTDELRVSPLEKNLLEHFLEFLADPDVAFLLLTIGGLAVVVELFNPGMIVPGVVGAILLILAFLALGSLPVNWAGAALIVLAMALGFLETQVSGFGVLGVAAIICLLLGGFLLFAQFGDPSPTLQPVSVSPWLIVGTAALLGSGLLYLVWTVRKSQKEEHGEDSVLHLGKIGTVVTELSPRGIVRMEDGNWTAVSDDDRVIGEGERVIVVDVNDLILTVIPFSEMD